MLLVLFCWFHSGQIHQSESNNSGEHNGTRGRDGRISNNPFQVFIIKSKAHAMHRSHRADLAQPEF